MGAIIQTTMNVRGLSQLADELASFGEAVAKKHMLKATMEASASVLEYARKKAPRGKGNKRNSAGSKIGHLADDLQKVKAKARNGSEVRYVIGSYFHSGLLHLVEFGTQPHRQGQGDHPGSRPQPFLRPAIDEGGGEAIDVFAKRIMEGVYQEGAKRRAKIKRLEKYLTVVGLGIQRSGVRL